MIGAAGCLALASPLGVTAQMLADPGAAPQEPVWSAPTSDVVPPLPGPDAPAETAAPIPAAADRSPLPPPDAFSLPSSAGAAPRAIPMSPPDPAVPGETGADAVGVPTASGNFLPSFEDYGRAFFERDGLRFRLGPVNLRFTLGLQFEHNDNIFGSSVDPVADNIASIIPGLLVGVGDFQGGQEDFFRLEYTPSFNYYQTETTQNRVNQNLAFAGQATFSRYSTEIEATYVSNNVPNATQTGGQNYSSFAIGWANRYFLSPKVFAGANLNVLAQDSENANGSDNNNYQTYSFAPQLGYAYSPKTTLTAGPYAGIAFIGQGGTQTFQGLTVGIQYDTLRKLTFNGTVGVQARQFSGLEATGATNFITPIFNFAATWRPREKTSLTTALVRDVQISDVVRGLTYTSTAFTLNVTQQVWKFSLGLGGSYQLLEYQGEDPFGRTENFVSLGGSVGYTFWRELFNLSIYYRYQERTSDVDNFNYVQNVYGVRLTYRF